MHKSLQEDAIELPNKTLTLIQCFKGTKVHKTFKKWN
jgi:hypothetical protein